jgi:hypothetical protein
MQDAQSPSTAPHVTFVVVNWNQRQLSLDCLASLYQQKYSDFDIVLVDNGSEDGSVAAMRTAFPRVAVLENGANLGIAAANNVGIRHALALNADYIFLLNNDTTVDPLMLERLVAFAESNSNIAATGPTMLYYDHPGTVWCAGNRIEWITGKTYRLHADEKLPSVIDSAPVDVDFITSCAVCIKAEVFREVGLMDEGYFIYYDETDWFARARSRGWRVVYVPQALMWHKVSAAMGTTSPATDYYMNRNMLRFLAKNRHGAGKVVALGMAAGRNLLAVAAYSVKSHDGKRIPHRNARLLAIRDAASGRWGKMGSDVEKVCYPSR